jgi:hypothetical protein
VGVSSVVDGGELGAAVALGFVCGGAVANMVDADALRSQAISRLGISTTYAGEGCSAALGGMQGGFASSSKSTERTRRRRDPSGVVLCGRVEKSSADCTPVPLTPSIAAAVDGIVDLMAMSKHHKL